MIVIAQEVFLEAIKLKNFLLKTAGLLSCCFMIALQPLQAQEKLKGIIDGGEVRGKPIAIVPFKSIDGTPIEHQLHEIIAFDLDASGKFESIPTKDFLSNPSRDEDVNYKDWRFINAEILVIGEVLTIDTDVYEVQFRMYDVVRQQQIGTGKRISGLSMSTLRTAAHVISDNVYEAFTARQGAFQSRMAYVVRKEIEYQRYRYQLMVSDWDGYGAVEIFC